jgi:carboxyl-terminal processing protease
LNNQVFVSEGRGNTGWWWRWIWLVLLVMRPGGVVGSPAEQEPKPAAAASLLTNGVETFDAAWRIIQDSHFDTNFHGLDWEAVRRELRPRAQAATTTGELRRIITRMLDRLGESHMALIPREAAGALGPREPNGPADASNATQRQPGNEGSPANGSSDLRSQEGNPQRASSNLAALSSRKHAPAPTQPIRRSTGANGDLGFEVRRWKDRYVVSRVEPGGPAAQAGVKPGWLLEMIGESSVAAIVSPLKPNGDKGLAEVMAWSVVTAAIHGNPGDSIRVRFLDGLGQTAELTLHFQRRSGEMVRLGLLPTLYAGLQKERIQTKGRVEVGIIRFNLWMLPVVKLLNEAVEEYRHADGIVIDLRGNVGGMVGMLMGVSGHFLKDRLSLGTFKTRDAELNLWSNPRLVNDEGQRVEPFAGPLAILIDGESISASEVFAGGMQAIGRARIFGQTTSGQALPAIFDKLPNGDLLLHAFADYVMPNGLRLEGRGVIPDEQIPLTRRDLLEGHDAPLEAAIQWISGYRKHTTKDAQRALSAGQSLGAR